jgi:hypothetical protein
MYYRDQYGNVTEYPGTYANDIHPGGVGYHPLTRENFSYADFGLWFEKYKMWFLYALIFIVVIMMMRWMMSGKKKSSSSSGSIFY